MLTSQETNTSSIVLEFVKKYMKVIPISRLEFYLTNVESQDGTVVWTSTIADDYLLTDKYI